MAEIKAYGIDLGTTYSVISEFDSNGNPSPIINPDTSNPFLASAVYFGEYSDTPVVGEQAKAMKADEPDSVLELVKRDIGTDTTYNINGNEYNPINVSAMYLTRMKEYTEQGGNCKVRNVVITCPAYFKERERFATKQAGEIAGLNVLNIINEPTAAALYYSYNQFPEARKALVYDLGGGTFDVSLVEFSVNQNGSSKVIVKDTNGDKKLGGKDWDEKLKDLICDLLKEETNEEPDEDSINYIESIVEKTKKGLTNTPQKTVVVQTNSGRQKIVVKREDFESCTEFLLNMTISFVKGLLESNNLTPDDIQDVYLVGGSTHMPMVKNAVINMFGESKVRINEPELAVSKGAVIAATMKLEEIVEKIKSESNQDTEGDFNPEPVPGSEPIDPTDYFNPDEIEGINKGDIGLVIGGVTPDKFDFNDILHSSYGVYALDSLTSKPIISNLLIKGQDLDSEGEGIFNPHEDNQSEVNICVFESDSKDDTISVDIDADTKMPKEDPSIGLHQVGNAILKLPPNTSKSTEINVQFKSNSGSLSVTATNKLTGDTVHVDLTILQGGMSQEQVEEEKEKMKKTNISGELF